MPFRIPEEPMFTVGQVSDMLRVQQPFLRRLESHNLIQPERSQGNQRRYTRADIDQVVRICGLVDDGLTLAGISRVLELEAEVRSLKAQLKAAQARANAPAKARPKAPAKAPPNRPASGAKGAASAP